METREGCCACGRTRYQLTSKPMFVHCCHCLDCQRQTGSAFALNALIEADRVELLSGDVEEIATPAPSGRPQLIYRCSICKVALWSVYGERRAIRFVRVGTLDEPSSLTPDVHIFTRSKQPWVRLPEGAPAFEVYYESEKLWPPESLVRRRAALG
ncbi:GFA family protein [Terrarubrum flagellatum]|uniref:GFA family protein n=1 Tax=Terrirubrum flagellatum TaxID=2895980 RepID=UPI0031452FB9